MNTQQPVKQPADQNERMWAMILHLSQLLNYIIPLGGVIAPIVIWQIKKDSMPTIDQHGKNVANFLVTYLLLIAISVVLVFVFIGIILLPILGIVHVIFSIIGGLKANEGVVWEYPCTFIKIFK